MALDKINGAALDHLTELAQELFNIEDERWLRFARAVNAVALQAGVPADELAGEVVGSLVEVGFNSTDV